MERIFLQDEQQIKAVKVFLASQSLTLDKFIDELYVLKLNGVIVGTAAIYSNVLKCIAIAERLKGTDTINKIMSFLTQRSYERGQTHLFIYTKPTTYESFEYFGFKKIAASENVILMENSVQGLDYYLDGLLEKNNKEAGTIGSVVVNCNPFTLGHQYLIETAAKACDCVHVFVVSEDRSTFPEAVRLELVKKGTAHLENVIVQEGSDYIISSATFPSYFLESKEQAVDEHVALDLSIFGEKIAKKLGITKRFIGQEPFNATTAQYNSAMKNMLPTYGIEVIELERKTHGDKAISASTVRKFISLNYIEQLKNLVPETTYQYLISESAQPVIKRIQETYKDNNLV